MRARALTALAAAIPLLLPVGGSQYWIDQLHLRQAWTTSTGADVVVGLLDTGVNANAEGLAGAVLPGAQFPDLGGGTADSDGHGTQMAQLIAGRGGSAGVQGVAPASRILPAKLDGGGADANAAIEWLADHGAKVINVSLGSGSPDDPAFDAGLRYAQDHDVVVVAAAGNATTDPGVVSPADRPGVLAVSAVDGAGRFRPDISVQGPAVALAAPGVDMLGHSGTSEAAAVVSGVVALVRAKFPGLSAAGAVARLTGTATKVGAGRNAEYGFGIVDPVAALTAPAADPWWPPVVLGLLAAAAIGAGWLVVYRIRREKVRA